MRIGFKVLADDKDITDKIKANLIAISITDTIGDHADGLSIQISDPEDNIKLPTESSKLQVYLGCEGDLKDFGYFFVDQVNYSYPPSKITITANSIPFAESTNYTAMQTQGRPKKPKQAVAIQFLSYRIFIRMKQRHKLLLIMY